MHFFRRKLACILATTILILSIPCGFALAVGHVDVDKNCTITVTVPSDYSDLNNSTIEVLLYRVGAISKNCEYSATEDFSDLSDALANVSSETTAEDWSDMAGTATSIVDGNSLTPYADFSVTGGSGSISSVETGLYLVYAKETKSQKYGYTFTPYLISAPNNEYASTGMGSDEWIYDNIQVSLKPEQYELTGDLEVVKTLKSYDTVMGNPIFVFDVEAYDENDNTVFSDVVSIAFDSAGQRSAKIKGIPAGSRVVVTEVYSGASYDATSEVSMNTQIAADEIAKVEFTNEYNHKLVYGTGVVNHFEYDGNGWEWNQITDNE